MNEFLRDPRDVREVHEAMLERELDPDFALISDYVCGELSEERATYVRARLESDPDFRDLAEPLLLAWSVPPKSKPMSHDELQHSWLQLRRRAGMPPVPGQEASDDREDLAAFFARRQRGRLRARRRTVLLAASIVFVLLGFPLAGIWWNRVFSPPPATEEIRMYLEAPLSLPDGSTALLKPGSVMRYVTGFKRGRELYLVGEGRFDVTRGEGSFTVMTQTAEISVAGTSFTVDGRDGAATTITVHDGMLYVRPRFSDPTKYREKILVVTGQRAQVKPNAQPELIP